MTMSKQEKPSGIFQPTISSSARSGSTRAEDSPTARLEQATKKLFRTTIKPEDRTVANALAAVQLGPGGLFFPQNSENRTIPTEATVQGTPQPITGPANSQSNADASCTGSKSMKLSNSSPATAQPRVHYFTANIAKPSFSSTFSPLGSRIESTSQLAYYNSLLRTFSSHATATTNITASLDPVQQASVEAILQNEEERTRIHWLTTKVIEEFGSNTIKSSAAISEVALLGPFLDQEYHRKLLNYMIVEFSTASLLDIDLLQGIIQLVECAASDYLLPDDLVHILVALRVRLEDTHQQSAKHSYFLTLALSHLLDVMVEGKVQDLRRVIDHEPLSALLGQLMNNSDVYLKHQAAYAMQGLLHVPNDETRRQYVLRQAGHITMGLLGVASVCKLDLSEFKDGVDHLYKAAGDVHDVGTKVVDGIRSLQESGQGIFVSMKGSILSGGRRLWYSALLEAKEHIRNGRFVDFNSLVFEAPCRHDDKFRWGICLILGEIVSDPNWGDAIHEHAIDFLGGLYNDCINRNSDEEFDTLILNILRQTVALPETAISNKAQLVLSGLRSVGNVYTQDLYRNFIAGPLHPYPLKVRLPPSLSSPLLTRVLAVPDVEYDIHRLRIQRMKKQENVLYISPLAKPTLQSSDDTLFPLMEKVLGFLSGSGQVFLLLGDSGGGKSTFNLQLEQNLWKDYKKGGPIPLHINLPSIVDPQQNMIVKQLLQLDFSDTQIQELKQHRQFIVICDGYDESQLKKNLHTTNLLNQPGQWRAKVIISCRSQYLGPDYRIRFQPVVDRYNPGVAGLFQEAVIASFTRSQINQYVEQHVQSLSLEAIQPTLEIWEAKDYINMLVKIPGLIELVSNPFLLTLALKALPKMTRSEQDLTKIQLSRVGLYDEFMEQWLETNKQRLGDSPLSSAAQIAFDELLDADFISQSINFQKNLAAAIFLHQGGNPVVEYSHLRDNKTWKAAFFAPDAQTTILRESSPLNRSGSQHRFLHRSVLEYLYSRVLSDTFDPNCHLAETDPADTTSCETFINHPLNQRTIVSEPSILQFLAERVELDPSFKSRLFAAIEDSKTDALVSKAAANAISVLVKAGVRFNGANLSGIRVPGANLCGAQFDSAELEGADLSNVNLNKAWLRQANLSKAQMTGVQFGELPFLNVWDLVSCCVFSSDGLYLAISTEEDEDIYIYNTTTWGKPAHYFGGPVIAFSPTIHELAKGGDGYTMELGDILTGETRLTLSGHGGEITSASYSPDGSQLATASTDTTVRIWSTLTGATLHVLHGHKQAVNGVTFSPSGLQLASCSNDKTLRIWDASTGEILDVLSGHPDAVLSVAYSPDGCQLVSGAKTGRIALWNVDTGQICNALAGYSGKAKAVTYSPDGHQIAACCADHTIRLWDSQTCEIVNTLTAHTGYTTSVAYSPMGNCIATGSTDTTVRLWKTGEDFSDAFSAKDLDGWRCVDISPDNKEIVTGTKDGMVQFWEILSGKPRVILKCHTELVTKVTFSPCGKRVVSGGSDSTMRMLCARTGTTEYVLEGHTGTIFSIAFSPTGHRIASAGRDRIVRIWDAQTGKAELLLEGHVDEVNCVTYSPNGLQIASCGDDQTARLWCSQTGNQLLTLKLPAPIHQVMYSLGEQELLSTFVLSTVSSWDPTSGESIDHLDLCATRANCCTTSPDGKLIASAGLTGELILWNRKSSEWVKVFRTLVGQTTQVQWKQGSDCAYMVTHGIGIVRVWKLIETPDSYTLQLCLSLGRRGLSLTGANFQGVVGLDAIDRTVARQRGVIME